MSGGLTGLDEIACQVGHARHETRWAEARPGPGHSYPMQVYDSDRYHHPEAYCPGDDVVSGTVAASGCWEPHETALVSLALKLAAQPGVVWDMGCQLGWYTLLAASYGHQVAALDAYDENLDVLRESLRLNGWEWQVSLLRHRVTGSSFPIPVQDVLLAKVDVEGAEFDAVRVLWPSIEARTIQHMLIEVSPVFGPGYPELVGRIIDAGYCAWLLGPEPKPLDTLERPAMEQLVEECGQENVWFTRG